MQKDIETKIKAVVKEVMLPLIRDMLILGSNAPIGPVAMSKTLEYLHVSKFVEIDCSDEIISTVFIRENLLIKVSKEQIIDFLFKRVKPIMMSTEIIQVEMDVETVIKEVI